MIRLSDISIYNIDGGVSACSLVHTERKIPEDRLQAFCNAVTKSYGWAQEYFYAKRYLDDERLQYLVARWKEPRPSGFLSGGFAAVDIEGNINAAFSDTNSQTFEGIRWKSVYCYPNI